MNKRPTREEDEALEAEMKAKMGRRIAALEAEGDYRLLDQFDVERAIAKAWQRILKGYGTQIRARPVGAPPQIDWVEIFQAEFKNALARELVHPVICDLLVEAGRPDPREGAREVAQEIMKEMAEEKKKKTLTSKKKANV